MRHRQHLSLHSSSPNSQSRRCLYFSPPLSPCTTQPFIWLVTRFSTRTSMCYIIKKAHLSRAFSWYQLFFVFTNNFNYHTWFPVNIIRIQGKDSCWLRSTYVFHCICWQLFKWSRTFIIIQMIRDSRGHEPTFPTWHKQSVNPCHSTKNIITFHTLGRCKLWVGFCTEVKWGHLSKYVI